MKKSDLLIVTPPLTQLNAPYPASMYLSAFLKSKGFIVHQYDLSIDLIEHIYSSDFLGAVFEKVSNRKSLSKTGKEFINRKDEYLQLVDKVKEFIRGKNLTLGNRISSRNLLPEGGRFKQIRDIDWWFGSVGRADLAKHLATLFFLDIADFIRENESPYFEFTRYAETLASSLTTFDPMFKSLSGQLNLIDEKMLKLLDQKLLETNPTLVAFTVPFPGNLYSALLCSQFIKTRYPEIRIVLGGGYINTELRKLSDPRIFSYVDFIIFDDGELPLLQLMNYLMDSRTPLLRTMVKRNDEVQQINFSDETVPLKTLPAPDYTGIDIMKYLSLMELPNPMHSLWNNGFWNKMQLARGCYWAKCTFCDTTLPYISNFDTQDASKIVNDIETIIGQTGETGFHFVDEAAPPLLLKKISEEIIYRKLTLTWWTNIRFEKNYTSELCKLMAKSGCIAVTGGIEVASNRILKMINKGVTLEQVALTLKNFRDAKILVHAYLMYGFPTQTEQEIIDSLEVVRQLFKFNLIQSGFWHRYAMTCHSETGTNPDKFGIKRVSYKPFPFANNEVKYFDAGNLDYNRFSKGLERALFNFIHGIGIDEHINSWFNFKTPSPKTPPDYIRMIIKKPLS